VWYYLGFFFDWTLSFKEHVQFYSTKTVRAMGMLGNSVQGLTPQNKWLLYHLCVMSITTYKCKLWMNSFSQVKGHLELLQKMQQWAAIWIMGTFCTSLNGGIKALAGLIPIHLHLWKLVLRGSYRIATLSQTHLTCTLTGRGAQAETTHHHLHLDNLSRKIVDKTKSSAVDLFVDLQDFLECFNTDCVEVRPGFRLMDSFSHQVRFVPSEQDADDHLLIQCLWHIWNAMECVPNSVLVATDGSVAQGDI
jgi:hypothetical protein